MHELRYIPLICSRCDWKGSHPSIEVADRTCGPAGWRLRCPTCLSVVEPDLHSVDFEAVKDFLARRWSLLGRPNLDPPGAATSARSFRPISDLPQWFSTLVPRENELIYVGQQLWSSFAEFVDALQSEPGILEQWENVETVPEFHLICVSDSDPKIECLDAKDGAVIWSYVNDQWNFAAPACSNQVIYFGSGDRRVTALSASDGKPLWRTACPEMVSSRPCIMADLVVVGCNFGIVVALETQSGKVKWTYDPDWYEDYIREVLKSPERIVAYSTEGRCFALSPVDGRLIWNAELLSASRIHLAGSVLIATIENEDLEIVELRAIDCLTGENAWSYPVPEPVRNFTVADPYLFYVTDGLEEDDLEPRLVGLQTDDSDSQHLLVEPGRIPLPRIMGADEILVHDGWLYGIDLPNLFRFDLTTSKLSWLKETGASRILGVEGPLLLVEDMGKLTLVEAETGSVVWTHARVSEVAVCQ
ncbi:MAG: PQQ-binding-like beta-propeller repeat protein [Dehalococcoidia bacterium]